MTQELDEPVDTIADARSKEVAAQARHRRLQRHPAYLRLIDDALERARNPNVAHISRTWRYR